MTEFQKKIEINRSLSSAPKEVALAMLQSWSEEGLGQSRSLIHPGSTAWLAHAAGATGSESNTGTEFGIDRWLDLLAGSIDSMPNGLKIIVHRIIAEDQWVSAEVESRGELTDGRVYNMRYTFWFQVIDGRIYHMKQYFDTKYGEQFFLNSHFE
ncbi:nuclear transport factor 2 family protein [Alkalihalobacillus sp. BA299]|uniref:nuclear transport factor 2 family protein n=1 Tax=Alkalihalobacillus sp. BA299 TaxID=2815938 RepID=UPI001AD9A8CD|nr:nuclear transport factor 2 family protein [Alkalihalobacillus sp. BA299]